ncbi:Cof-type HAD-IIB family hydrolase [Clostridiaceae bacterium M8S5]|nr:Cof-type HAD-IIB family hydrolase [Clostridiaceae bacterium M8S5]
MNYKLVAIDLDGTLLNDEKTISKQNIEVLTKVIELGVEVVIATGRSYHSAKQFIKDSKLDLVIMANNGNIVRNIKDDKTILSKYLHDEHLHILLKEGRKIDLYPIIHVDHYDEGYDMIIELNKNHEKYSSYLKNVKRYKEIQNGLDYNCGKVLSVCYISDEKTLERLYSILKQRYSELYSSHILRTLSKVGTMLEVMKVNASKWDTIKSYADSKNIETNQIMSIGDDMNDLSMIKESGLGIAMKNGHEDIKAFADIVSDRTNNQNGVGHILKKIFNL